MAVASWERWLPLWMASRRGASAIRRLARGSETTARSGRRLATRLSGPQSLEPRHALAAQPLPAYDTSLPAGAPAVEQFWVDPAVGNDANSGASRTAAFRTLTEAWRRIPMNADLARGFQINLAAGTYPESAVPLYWESRHGTQAAPVILKAIDGDGTARLPTLNIYDCRHLRLIGLDVTAGGGDVVHLDSCSHVLLRGMTIRGTGDIAAYASPQEALKVNQSQHIYVEGCDVSGAFDNAIDFVAVQYGHVVGSRVHRALDWAMYVKGGSASIVVQGNQFYDAGTGGFTAGQGTGLEFMVAPWIQYEAYDIRFTDNVVHDTEGAGFGVNGGIDIVMARNVLYRVGSRSHVIEVGFGSHSCDGDQARCRALLAQGGWGTAVVGGDEPIPNRNVSIVDNVVLNPDGFSSRWQHFALAEPRTPSPGSNIPSPARADTNLVIRGNTIWNGPADHPLGFSMEPLASQVLAGNSINVVRPVLADPARGDYSVISPTLPPVVPPVDPPVPPVPVAALTAVFVQIAATTRQPVTSLTVTFNRAVSGVTLDDFVLTRGRTSLSLAGARITTADRITYTIENIPPTRLAAGYTLRLKATGTGIVDDAARALNVGASVAWRMTRTVPLRPTASVRGR